MKARILGNIQEITEVAHVDEIKFDGLYALAGSARPVFAARVTPYGVEQIEEQHPNAWFFVNEDGVPFYAMETGEFVHEVVY